jgi:hypothetical protein
MTSDQNLKDISNVDLESWVKFAHLGSIGIIFFSENFKTLDSSLLEFFIKCHSTSDSVIILTPENALTDDNKKVIALLPFVHFFYSNNNFLQFIEKLGCKHFFKREGQKTPDFLNKVISDLENCEVHEF